MAKEGKIEVTGTIIEALPAGKFIVNLDEEFGKDIIIKEAYLKGKLRKNNIKIIVGDRVRLELGQYDLNKGMISHRL